jgi:GH24 family phage-related lysozyme (muramidase)
MWGLPSLSTVLETLRLKPLPAPAMAEPRPTVTEPPPAAPVTPAVVLETAPALVVAGLTLSSDYVGLLNKLEGLSGAVKGKPGIFTWFFDNVGVATLGYGHVLHHPVNGGQITKKLYGDACTSLANQAMMKYYGETEITLQQVLDLKKQDMQNYANNAIPHIRADTIQCQFDMLVDFAYNVGEHSLETSTLLRLHDAGDCPIGVLDPATLCANSKSKAPITTIGGAFCAWSNSGGAWTLGVFHRRLCEVLVYSGMDYSKAYTTAWLFRD